MCLLSLGCIQLIIVMWQIQLIVWLMYFHLQKYGPSVGSYIEIFFVNTTKQINKKVDSFFFKVTKLEVDTIGVD